MRDLYHNADVVEAIAPAALDDDNTPAAIDLQGFRSALIAIHVGVGGITFTGTNRVDFKLTHSDDDDDYEAVKIEDVQGLDSVGEGGILLSLTAAHAASTVTRVGYVGGKRYLKLLADFGGTHNAATPMSAVVMKGEPAIAPVAA